MTEIISTFITGLFGLLVVWIEVRTSKDRKRTEARAAVRAKESRLSMAMSAANTKQGIVTAKAVTHQHTNGDVEEAIVAAKAAQAEYQAFVEGIASEHVTKT